MEFRDECFTSLSSLPGSGRMKSGPCGYDPCVIARPFLPSRRTERTIVVLRALVAALVALHVLLVLDDLRVESLLVPAVLAALALTCTTVAGLVVLLLGSVRTIATTGMVLAIVDAVALVTIARVTIQVDPLATIAWAFVLWAPFCIAIRSSTVGAIAGSAAVAVLVLGSTFVQIGALDPLARTWTGVGVPLLLVIVAGVLTALATLSHHRSGMVVRRQLDDERDRALRLREADDLKNTFLAAVSHELRTPLTSILGFAVTMLDRPELDDAQRVRMLRTIVEEAEHLEDILANLLDLDRLTRGKATLVPVDVDPAVVVREAVAHVERRSGRVIGVDLTAGLQVRVDVAKVERIVENLVVNAVKYTPDTADVTVHMHPDSRGIVIRVDDGGPGIGSELRETIFEPFRRGKDVGVPGTGIGLSLVDRFSRMHGGRAWVEERPGGGCRFQVYLPSNVAPGTPRGPGTGDGSGHGSVAISSLHG